MFIGTCAHHTQSKIWHEMKIILKLAAIFLLVEFVVAAEEDDLLHSWFGDNPALLVTDDANLDDSQRPEDGVKAISYWFGPGKQAAPPKVEAEEEVEALSYWFGPGKAATPAKPDPTRQKTANKKAVSSEELPSAKDEPPPASESESKETASDSKSQDRSDRVENQCGKGSTSYRNLCSDISIHPKQLQRSVQEYCKKYEELCKSAAQTDSRKGSKSKEKSKGEESEEESSVESEEATKSKSKSKPKSKSKKSKSKSESKSKSKSKAKSKSKSKSKSVESESHSHEESNKDADEEFKKCCDETTDLEDSCKYLCKYSNINKEKLVDAFFQGACPGDTSRHVITCASSGLDHTECCITHGVNLHFFGFCMAFCNPAVTKVDLMLGAAFCLDILPQVAHCFQDAINNKV